MSESPSQLSSNTLIGMVHLPPLPGAPGFGGSLDDVIAHACADARTLVDGGFNALIVENFGDAPFVADDLEPVTVAAMAVVVRQVCSAAGAPIGVNCLRNDARSALGIAAACGGRMIRVNVHTGVYATDQGMITGRAYETVRLRDRLDPAIRILADVHVKHAVPVNQHDIAQAAEETAYRGGADAVIVSGTATGKPVDPSDLAKVKTAVPDKPVLVGSGVTVESVAQMLAIADGVIVGSALKPGGDISAPVCPELVGGFVVAARAVRR